MASLLVIKPDGISSPDPRVARSNHLGIRLTDGQQVVYGLPRGIRAADQRAAAAKITGRRRGEISMKRMAVRFLIRFGGALSGALALVHSPAFGQEAAPTQGSQI